MNIESLEYELGKMMFNTTASEIDTVEKIPTIVSTNCTEYDMLKNFIHILTSLKDEIDIDDLKAGFLSEANSLSITDAEAREYFELAKIRIEKFINEEVDL